MTPSYSCLAFSSTLSRRVVPYFSRLTNPASSYSSESPSPNFESTTSNACMEAAMISGPIPSHGKTRSLIAYPHTVLGERRPVQPLIVIVIMVISIYKSNLASTCMGHTGVKPGTVRPDPSQPLILVYCSLALVQCTTIQGELATGRRPSRHILVFGGSRGSRP